MKFPTGGYSPRLLSFEGTDLVEFQNRQLQSGWEKKMEQSVRLFRWTYRIVFHFHVPKSYLTFKSKYSMETLLETFGSTSTERVENALLKLQQGKGIILVDDENRENEGDIIFPASTITEQDMALLIRECSGIVCLCISEEKSRYLNLRPMVENNTSKNQTAFTISIEAKEGVSSGVSAKDRVTTIKAATSQSAQAEDIASPGHIFPLIARKNGVFERRGHTEGSVDLVKLARLGEDAVLCELTNEDGSMARLPEIVDFAVKKQMSVVTIEDIYSYRKTKISQN